MTKAKTKVDRKPTPRRRQPPPAVNTQPVSHAYCPWPDELDKSVPNLKHIGGSKSDIWNQYLANHAMRAEWYGSDPQPGKDLKDHKTAVLAFLVGVKPADVIEGMMAAQLFASHAAAMECYRRAALPNQTEYGREMNLTHAAKLAKANAAQVEALAKHRNKGQQRVTVEHVHVYQGGQAAFIANRAPGEGVSKLNEGQPHAIGYAERGTLPCQDPQGCALPSGGDAERTLSDARRPVSRRS